MDRASCDPVDPGYQAWLKHRPLRVFVDAVEQRRCVTADEFHGYVERHVVDGAGRLQLDASGTDVLRERVYGFVVIERVPGPTLFESMRTAINNWTADFETYVLFEAAMTHDQRGRP